MGAGAQVPKQPTLGPGPMGPRCRMTLQAALVADSVAKRISRSSIIYFGTLLGHKLHAVTGPAGLAPQTVQ